MLKLYLVTILTREHILLPVLVDALAITHLHIAKLCHANHHSEVPISGFHVSVVGVTCHLPAVAGSSRVKWHVPQQEWRNGQPEGGCHGKILKGG